MAALRQISFPVFRSRHRTTKLYFVLGCLIPKTRSGWSSGLGKDASTSRVFTEESRKILSPQTTGLETPRPSIGTFHLIFSDSLQVIGGVAVRETPFASGPRHWCQFLAPCTSFKRPEEKVVREAKRKIKFPKK